MADNCPDDPRKWIIPNRSQSEFDWERNYAKFGNTNYWRISHDPRLCQKLVDHLASDIGTILVLGCGAETHLQQLLLKSFPEINQIVCSDISNHALEQARRSFDSPQIHYCQEDSRNLSFVNHRFDAIVCINSILSASDSDNRQMVQECFRTLVPGGRFVGLFPSIFSALEISYLEPRARFLRSSGAICMDRSSFRYRKSGLEQIYYTPLRLAQIFSEVGFERERFEIIFCDSENMQQESQRMYGIPMGSSLYPWEILAVLGKRS